MKDNTLVYMFRKTWHYSAGNRTKLRLSWLLFIIGNAFILIVDPLVIAHVINLIQKEGVTRENFTHIALCLSIATVLSSLIFWACHGPARVIEECNATRAGARYRKFLFRGVLSLPLKWHTDHHSGMTNDKLDKGHDGLHDFASQSFQIISGVVQLLVAYAMLAYFSWPSAIIVLAMLVVAISVTICFDTTIMANYKKLKEAENVVAKSIADALNNITTIIILRVERHIFDSVSKRIDEPYELGRITSILNETKWFLVSFCCNTMTLVVLVVYLYQQLHIAGVVMIGSFFALYNYLERIGNLFFAFTGMYSQVMQNRTRIANAEDVAVDFREVDSTPHVLPLDWREIEVSGLNFSHHGGSGAQHLNDLNIIVKRGERIALVGERGSGKTTFLQMLRGLHDPSSLRLTVDSSTVIVEGFKGIEQAITLVPQAPELLSESILYNLTMGGDYPMEMVHRAVEMATMTEVIESMPMKYDSIVGEKGVRLSVGQRQCLAAARSLLACMDKSIVLLDEVTSNVDAINEHSIYEQLLASFTDKTVIASLHGRHLLPHFGRIIMFDQGRIVADGTHDELMAISPQFRALMKSVPRKEVTTIDS